MTNPENYRTYMQTALLYAKRSDDPSTQTGAVIVAQDGRILSAGANLMPEGVEKTPERMERPLKYQVREHAERAAIYEAARLGRATMDACMVSLWAACSDCSRGVIDSGIKTFICYPWEPGENHNHWDADIAVGRDIMREAGVEVVDYDFPGLEIPELRRNGGLWAPTRS